MYGMETFSVSVTEEIQSHPISEKSSGDGVLGHAWRNLGGVSSNETIVNATRQTPVPFETNSLTETLQMSDFFTIMLVPMSGLLLFEKFDWEVLQYPPHSPDLAPSDFHLFGPLKKFLEGHRFGSNEEMKSVVSR